LTTDHYKESYIPGHNSMYHGWIDKLSECNKVRYLFSF